MGAERVEGAGSHCGSWFLERRGDVRVGMVDVRLFCVLRGKNIGTLCLIVSML